MTQAPRYERLLSSLPLADRAKQDLERRMTEPSRYYHDIHHLDLLWERHLRYRDHCVDEPRQSLEPLIALAIAYHDAVFVAGDPDNEPRSAALWLEVSATATDLTLDERLWVAGTIRATADHIGAAKMLDINAADGFARQWVLDLDLTPLGEAPDTFDRNMALLEAEAMIGSSTATQRGSGLQAALRHFASARPLYRTQPLASAFAGLAQRNFSRHLPTE